MQRPISIYTQLIDTIHGVKDTQTAQGDQPVLKRINAHRQHLFHDRLLRPNLIHSGVQKKHEHDSSEVSQNHFSERGLDWPLAGEPLKSLIE